MRKPIVWLAGGMVLGSLITAPVAAGAESLQVVISQVKLMINGVDKTPAGGTFSNGVAQVPIAFNYEGTTYVPVKYVSEALGYPVEWDGPNRTIWVGTKPGAGLSQAVRPEPDLPVTFTEVRSAVFDAGDSNLVQVSVAVRNDDTQSFSFFGYQPEFVSRDGGKYKGFVYVPQGYDSEVQPKTTGILQYYAMIPKGISVEDMTLNLTKADFSVFPAQFKTWASFSVGKPSTVTPKVYTSADSPVFDLMPYHVQLSQVTFWSYDYKAYAQVYKVHVTTTKDSGYNAYPNNTDLIFEVIDGNGTTVAQTRYAIGASANSSVPVLGDGDQYITFNNLIWSRYNNYNVTIRVYEAFNQGKRLIGTFSL
ncbi:stalk domain-containing protein [Effusibacillus pohliae]|uniref:stalk domain-containing protein n=1 Tax=Effusibacillus pohliae TaxID=232270 RepID=UPI00037F4A30|nr:stalk domain-containing protein [Effusibacillus pohliae]